MMSPFLDFTGGEVESTGVPKPNNLPILDTRELESGIAVGSADRQSAMGEPFPYDWGLGDVSQCLEPVSSTEPNFLGEQPRGTYGGGQNPSHEHLIQEMLPSEDFAFLDEEIPWSAPKPQLDQSYVSTSLQSTMSQQFPLEGQQTFQQSLETPYSLYGNNLSNESGLPKSSLHFAENRRARSPTPSSSLPRRRSRYTVRRLGKQTTAIPVPHTDAVLDPMQRWQESPPEDEPASLSAIKHAVDAMQHQGHPSSGANGFAIPSPHVSSHSSRPGSLASSRSSHGGTSTSSWQSSASLRRSSQEETLGVQFLKIGNRVRKTRKKSIKPETLANQRVFPCTFCCDTFKTKHDWSRHERSLHLNLGGWICAPHGCSPISPSSGRRHCAYCNCIEPSNEHLEQHNHTQCLNARRTFRRKDHLVQHLKHVHCVDAIPAIEEWKVEGPTVTSRCGFCDGSLGTWDRRVDHLAQHFREGTTMKEWRGDHDFPPDIAAKVTNALPPYLIGSESQTCVPFSATDTTTKDHFNQISAQVSNRAGWNVDLVSEAKEAGYKPDQTLALSLQQLHMVPETPLKTFAEILTQHLSRYARQQMSQGIVPTDEMFQRESRRVLYDSEDSWNQSIADNPQWISAFRKEHCLDSLETGPSKDTNEPEGR